MMNRIEFSRRNFLRTTALAGFPLLLPARLLGASAPSNRIGLGLIGAGGRGTADMDSGLDSPEAHVLAVCDVDRARRDKAKARVDQHYGDTACAACHDFRELLARPDIDAVLVCTPENWHSLITIAAAKAGKDIYCEKPFAPTIAEGRAAANAVRRCGRILQTGSQERSRPGGRFACALARSGALGRLHTVRVNLPAERHEIPLQPVEPVPEGFDYNFWLGPAPWAPYTPKRCHGNFRWLLDYSDGELTDRGCHVGDLAQYGSGMDRTGPVAIEGRGVFPAEGLWNTAYEYEIHARYANGVKLEIASVEPRGVKFEGDEGWVFYHVHSGELEASSKALLSLKVPGNPLHLTDTTNDHFQNWLHCIRSRNEPVAPAEGGHRSSSLCHLANIAIQLKRPLRWDPVAERFEGDEGANAMVTRAMREPWRMV